MAKRRGQTVTAQAGQVRTKTRRGADREMKVSQLPCGSGSAWVKNQTKAFRVWREIRRGRRKGCYEIEVIVSTKHGAVWRKVVVEADAIRYLPRGAGPYQPGLVDIEK